MQAVSPARVSWPEVRPHVTMIAEPARDGFAFGFVLMPGADLDALALDWSGVDGARIVGRDVELDVAGSRVTVGSPRAWVKSGEGLVPVSIEPTLERASTSTRLRWRVPTWDRATPLLIDPDLGWTTVLGGAADDESRSIATDAAGNVYVLGITKSADFPATAGLDTTLAGLPDAFVAKLDPTGKLVYATYLGGSGDEDPRNIAVSASGRVLVGGATSSSDFPTKNAHQATLAGSNDAFVTCLDSAGTVAWSTYFGGTVGYASGVAFDGAGDVFVAGGLTGGTTVGGFDTTFGGVSDAFVAKLSAAGVLSWSTFVGGSAGDYAVGRIATDAAGNVLLSGITASSDFPTAGAFRSALVPGDPADAFVTKVSGAGALVWSTQLGGAGFDNAYSLAVDTAGNAYVVGQTSSNDFPTVGGFDTTFTGLREGFLTKIGSGGALVWSSYLGGKDDDTVADVATAGVNVFVSGLTFSDDFPTKLAFEPTFVPTVQNFVAKVTSAGALTWSSYLHVNWGSAIATGGPGDLFVAGGGPASPASTFDVRVMQIAQDAPLGTPCGFDVTCASLRCVDSVCCNAACAGPCEACSAARKGAGIDGACAPVADGTDPKDVCGVGSTACGPDGSCDGLGACRVFARAATECAPPACVDNAFTTSTCPGDAATCGTTSAPCAPYACTTAGCRTACVTDAQCAPNAYCDAATCKPKVGNGTACVLAGECLSGFCVDGVCCERACDRQCEACGADGFCKPVSGAPVGGRAACGGDPSCEGTCDGTDPTHCRYPAGNTCHQICSDGVSTTSRCDLAGSCIKAEAVDCAGYACTGDRCATSCSSNADCKSPHLCVDGRCVTPSSDAGSDDAATDPDPAPPADDSGCGCRLTNTTGSSASSGALLLLLLAISMRRSRMRSTVRHSPSARSR